MSIDFVHIKRNHVLADDASGTLSRNREADVCDLLTHIQYFIMTKDRAMRLASLSLWDNQSHLIPKNHATYVGAKLYQCFSMHQICTGLETLK